MFVSIPLTYPKLSIRPSIHPSVQSLSLMSIQWKPALNLTVRARVKANICRRRLTLWGLITFYENKLWQKIILLPLVVKINIYQIQIGVLNSKQQPREPTWFFSTCPPIRKHWVVVQIWWGGWEEEEIWYYSMGLFLGGKKGVCAHIRHCWTRNLAL